MEPEQHQDQPIVTDPTSTITDQAITLSQQTPALPTRLSLDMIQLMNALAPMWHKSRWFGIGSPEQAVVLMAKAADLGLPFTAAFDFFDVIEGRPAIKPVGALALIHRSCKIDVSIDDHQPDQCTVRMRRRDTHFEHTVTYTKAEAKASGLIKDEKAGSAWVRFLKDMLRNRAIGRCARIVAPDILAGLYLTTELESPTAPESAIVEVQP